MATVSNEQLARDYPSVATAGVYFGATDFDETFEFGLDMPDEMERLRDGANAS